MRTAATDAAHHDGPYGFVHHASHDGCGLRRLSALDGQPGLCLAARSSGPGVIATHPG